MCVCSCGGLFFGVLRARFCSTTSSVVFTMFTLIQRYPISVKCIFHEFNVQKSHVNYIRLYLSKSPNIYHFSPIFMAGGDQKRGH